MNKAAKQIAVCAGILILFCVLCRLVFFREHSVYLHLYPSSREAAEAGELSPQTEDPDVLRIKKAEVRGEALRIRVQPVGKGATDLLVHGPDGGTVGFIPIRVTPLGTVYDYTTGGFTGDSAVMIALTLFWLLIGAIMLRHFLMARGADFYSYLSVYYAGFSLFSLCTGFMMAQVTMQHILHPDTFVMLSAYSAINGAAMRFMILTLPLTVLFALAMAVSNIVLLRHEHPSVRNVLGLICAILLLAGAALSVWLKTRDFSGSEWEGRVQSTLENVYATVFSYFECMLAGAVICTRIAARRRPAADRDCIIILGCWFRPDGTLPPLLRGRVDAAVRFRQQQILETGRQPLLIPAGGQGADEPMPEAQAMRRYLIGKGIPDESVIPENKSRSTLENMKNARDIIRQVCPEGKIAFATTDYHVFRGGLWAAQAGLRAEGIGSRAAWWFWPNAFMRECAGLLAFRWKQELLLLAVITAFFALLTLIL